MDAQGFRYNDYTVSVVIQLYSHLNMMDKAWAFYKKFNFENNFVHSCIIKINAQH